VPAAALLWPIRNSISLLNPFRPNMWEQDFMPCKKTIHGILKQTARKETDKILSKYTHTDIVELTEKRIHYIIKDFSFSMKRFHLTRLLELN